MIQWREGVVTKVRRQWSDAVELAVRVTSGPDVVAIAYASLVGRPDVDDTVLLNTSALERGLGTGGMAIVVAVPHRLPAPVALAERPGHIVKARYTPSQTMVLGVDEQDSPHHGVLQDADDLGGMPVVVADLHSALPAVLAGIRAERPDARVGYVMTDGGALPMAFSRTVAALEDAGWLSTSITVGQAFGGRHEAVNVHTGLLAARLVDRADIAVVAQGPGNLGTGTRWGFSGTSAGEAANAAHTLKGRAVCSLRLSEADVRGRHRGLSHHSVTAYGRVTLVPADLPVPLLPGAFGADVLDAVHDLARASAGRLRVREVEVDGLEEALRTTPVTLSTMGRGYDEDRASFLAAAVAGRFAARDLLSAKPACCDCAVAPSEQ